MNTSVKMARVVPVVRMALLAILFLSQIPSAQARMVTLPFSVRVTELSTEHDDGRLDGIQIGDELKGSLEFEPSCYWWDTPTRCSDYSGGGFEYLGGLIPQIERWWPLEAGILNDYSGQDAVYFRSELDSTWGISEIDTWEAWRISGFTTDLTVIKCARWSCIPDMSEWPEAEPMMFYFDYLVGDRYDGYDDAYYGSLKGVVTYLGVVPIPAAAWLFLSAVGGLGAVAWRQRKAA